MGMLRTFKSVLAVASVVVTVSLTLLTPAKGVSAAESAHKDVAFTQFFCRTKGWTAGDGAFSIQLSDGRVLWLFGDSHVDDYENSSKTIPCLFQVRNAGIAHQRTDLTNAQTFIGRGPGFKSWFKNPVNEKEWFWPLSGFQKGKIIWVYLSSLRQTGEGGMWGFESTGQDYWAKINFPEMDKVAYLGLPDLKGITFGSGFVTEAEFIYAFGSKRTGLASDVFVARFNSDNPDTNWTFWDGHEWSAYVTNATPVARGASSSVHICKVKDKYLLTTSAFSVACDEGSEIFISTSKSPTGPFSTRKTIFKVDDVYEGHRPFFYLPIAHPEFINQQGEILVTYSINGYEPCISTCVNGRAIPDHYRPKAIRAPLALIDVDFQGVKPTQAIQR
jgi:hypothetical protein